MLQVRLLLLMARASFMVTLHMRTTPMILALILVGVAFSTIIVCVLMRGDCARKVQSLAKTLREFACRFCCLAIGFGLALAIRIAVTSGFCVVELVCALACRQ